jgi:hypothetical protein
MNRKGEKLEKKKQGTGMLSKEYFHGGHETFFLSFALKSDST